MDDRLRFDADNDWQAYDAPMPGDPDDGSTTHSSNSSNSTRPPSPAPSSIPGPYVPRHRRGGDMDGVLQDEQGGVARVSRRGNLKTLGAPYDKPGAFRKVQLVPFALTEKKLKYMQGNFPNTFFSVTKDQNHDHPIAHLETMIATRHMLDTVHDGAQVLDMYGNPRARDTFMARRDLRGRNMESVVSLETEKDYLRKNTKWGNPHDAMGNIRYHIMSIDDVLAAQNAAWLAQFDVFCFVHTAYYVDMDKMVDLLSRNERSVAKMICHRHDKEYGKLFDGEVEYTSRRGFVIQRNVQTGERYCHPSLEWLFTSTTKVWRSARGAITWTFKRVTDETWIIDMAWCPNDLDERFTSYLNATDARDASYRMNCESLVDTNPTAAVPQLPDGEVISYGGVLTVKPNGLHRPLRITNPKYLEYLSSAVVGKPRNEDQLKDLFALARRENSLTSTFPGSRRFEVPVDEVADHVVAAFLNGIDRETELFSVLRAAEDAVRKHDNLINGRVAQISTTGGQLRTGIAIAREINNVRRSADTFGAILDAVEKRT